MKTIPVGFVLALALGGGAAVQAASSHEVAPVQVGVYDSRAIAYAYFWSDAATAERTRLVQAAKAAATAGDADRLKTLQRRLSEMQNRSHLQVFSTLPADEALAALKDRLAAIQSELGVARFVSKWDERGLSGVSASDCVDVTDRLVRELFTPTPRHVKILDSMKANPPLPLEKARALAAAGKL